MQCQIYLSIAETKYLRRSQRYEKSSAEANRRFVFASDGVRGIYLRRLRGRALREPPKIAPLRGAVVRAAASACAVLRIAFSVFGMLFADGGRNAPAVRRSGAAANCAVQRTAGVVNGKVFGPWPAGNATMRMPLRASARRGCGPRDSASRLFSFNNFLYVTFCSDKR